MWHYSLRNSIRQISRIKHEFLRHLLRDKLIGTLNNTSETITEMVISQSQKNCIAYIKNDLIDTYRDCCNISNCYMLYVVTHESTENKIYLHYYEITCNLFFYCRISLTIFFYINEFCSKCYTVTAHILEVILLYM